MPVGGLSNDLQSAGLIQLTAIAFLDADASLHVPVDACELVSHSLRNNYPYLGLAEHHMIRVYCCGYQHFDPPVRRSKTAQVAKFDNDG